MIANRVGKVIDYVLEEERDKPESERTTFKLRTLSRKATAIIQDNLVGYDLTGSVLTSRPGTGALTAVKLGLQGWSNMQDEDGQEVRPKFIVGKGAGGLKVLSPATLDLLPQHVIDELGGAIMELNGLGRSAGEEEEDEATAGDEAADEDPTASSTTARSSASPEPSPPATPSSATDSSPTSAPVRLVQD